MVLLKKLQQNKCSLLTTIFVALNGVSNGAITDTVATDSGLLRTRSRRLPIPNLQAVRFGNANGKTLMKTQSPPLNLKYGRIILRQSTSITVPQDNVTKDYSELPPNPGSKEFRSKSRCSTESDPSDQGDIHYSSHSSDDVSATNRKESDEEPRRYSWHFTPSIIKPTIENPDTDINNTLESSPEMTTSTTEQVMNRHESLLENAPAFIISFEKLMRDDADMLIEATPALKKLKEQWQIIKSGLKLIEMRYLKLQYNLYSFRLAHIQINSYLLRLEQKTRTDKQMYLVLSDTVHKLNEQIEGWRSIFSEALSLLEAQKILPVSPLLQKSTLENELKFYKNRKEKNDDLIERIVPEAASTRTETYKESIESDNPNFDANLSAVEDSVSERPSLNDVPVCSVDPIKLEQDFKLSRLIKRFLVTVIAPSVFKSEKISNTPSYVTISQKEMASVLTFLKEEVQRNRGFLYATEERGNAMQWFKIIEEQADSLNNIELERLLIIKVIIDNQKFIERLFKGETIKREDYLKNVSSEFHDFKSDSSINIGDDAGRFIMNYTNQIRIHKDMFKDDVKFQDLASRDDWSVRFLSEKENVMALFDRIWDIIKLEELFYSKVKPSFKILKKHLDPTEMKEMLNKVLSSESADAAEAIDHLSIEIDRFRKDIRIIHNEMWEWKYMITKLDEEIEVKNKMYSDLKEIVKEMMHYLDKHDIDWASESLLSMVSHSFLDEYKAKELNFTKEMKKKNQTLILYLSPIKSVIWSRVVRVSPSVTKNISSGEMELRKPYIKEVDLLRSKGKIPRIENNQMKYVGPGSLSRKK